MAELDTKSGIGLVERVRVGLGRADRIYVLNFVNDCPSSDCVDIKSNSGTLGDVANKNGSSKDSAYTNSPEAASVTRAKITTPGVDNPQKYKNHTSASSIKIRPQEVIKSYPSNTEKNNTVTLSISHVSQSNNTGISMPSRDRTTKLTAQKYESIRTAVAEQIEADTLKEAHGEVIDEIVEIIVDVMVSPAPTIRIAKADRQTEMLRAQFARLTAAHVEAALWNLRKHASDPITDVKAYMLALLYDALFSLNLRVATEIGT